MAESSKAFKMYHYQQIKCETKTEAGQYMKIRGRYSSKKGENDEKQTQIKSQIHIHGLQMMIQEDINQMKRLCIRE